MSLVSIIIPVYKAEPYLSRCLESVINQTHRNLEIILVDDGSQDRSGEICDEYGKKDTRVKVIHQENKGVSAARNAGLDIAKGQYIGFVDSDDWIEPTMFEMLLKSISENNTQIAACAYKTIFSNGIERISDPQGMHKLWTKQEFIKIILTQSTVRGFLCNKLFDAKLLLTVRLKTDFDILEDMYFIFSMLPDVQTISYVATALYYYFCHNNSATNKIDYLFDKNRKFKYCLVYEEIYRTFSYPNLPMRAYIDCICMDVILDTKILCINTRSAQQWQLNELSALLKKYRSAILQYRNFSVKRLLTYIIIRFMPFTYKPIKALINVIKKPFTLV